MEIQRVRVSRNLWKTNLTREIINLEDNLDQIYLAAGYKPRRVVSEDENDEGALATNDKRLTGEIGDDFEIAIDELVAETKQAVNNICALISSVTEFDLPIPVLVLLKLAGRVGSIRCTDFSRKVPGSLAKKYILIKKSLDLIESSILMHKWISIILGANILPFQPHINQNMIGLLEWTRTSYLYKHDESRYYSIRSQVIENITESLEQLSLNLNLDSRQLESLVDQELIKTIEDSLESAAAATPAVTSLDHQKRAPAANQSQKQRSPIDKHTDGALVCLDRLFVVYAYYLGAKLEARLKNFIIHTSIKIYRDFESANVIGLASRRLLICLLETIANRPYATSTSELAMHIFELAERLESDPEIRYLCRRAVKFGLAHRPIVVSHFDVFDCQASALRNGVPGESVAPGESISPLAVSTNAVLAENIEPPKKVAAPAEKVVAPAEKVANPAEKVEDPADKVAEPAVSGSLAPSNVHVVTAPPPAPESTAPLSPVTSTVVPVMNASALSKPSIALEASSVPAHITTESDPIHATIAATPEAIVCPMITTPTQPPETIVAPAASSANPEIVVIDDDEDNNGLDEQVQSYLDLFVDKPATTLPAQSQAQPAPAASADTNGGQPLLNKP